MTFKTIANLSIVLTALFATAACANTIRGMGQDTANTVNATQAAAGDVEDSAY